MAPVLVGSEKKDMPCIFELQLYYAKPGSFAVGVTDYGVGETRLALEGKELVIGLPTVHVPGVLCSFLCFL